MKLVSDFKYFVAGVAGILCLATGANAENIGGQPGPVIRDFREAPQAPPPTSQSTEEAQFAILDAQKHRRERGADLAYVASAKLKVDKAWRECHLPADSKLLITNVKVTLDSTGKMTDCKILKPSGSEPEDRSVQDCLNTLILPSLRSGLSTLDLFWTLMSVGSQKLVECTDSPEANSYYTSLIGCKIPPSGDWRTFQSTKSGEVILLNNSGVMALKANNYPLAFENFKAALKIDPKYQLARDNLPIAHNMYGLQLLGKPKEALKEFHEALYLFPTNPVTLKNMEMAIKLMGKDPHLFEDRVVLGDEAKSAADYIGAVIEYSEALKISENPEVRTKLEEATKALAELRAGGAAIHD